MFAFSFVISSTRSFSAPGLSGNKTKILSNLPIAARPLSTICPKRYMSTFPPARITATFLPGAGLLSRR